MHLTASPFILSETKQGGSSWAGVETHMSHHVLFSKAVLGSLFCHLSCACKSDRAASCIPQVTLLSFSVDSEFTFVDYIKGG